MSRCFVVSNNGCSPLLYIRVISLEQNLNDLKEPSITFIPLEKIYFCLEGVCFSLRQFVLCKNSCTFASCYELSTLYLRQKINMFYFLWIFGSLSP